MADNPSNIYGHAYQYGADKSLALAINNQSSPSILVAYLDYLGGQFSGMTVWKHRLTAYIRPKNAAVGLTSSNTRAASPQHIFWLMMNSPVLGGEQNFRYIELTPGLALVDAMPSLTHQTDEQGADFFQVLMTFPEIGDA